ncbi:MAG: DUF2809 domain-containing protein [bacterium]
MLRTRVGFVALALGTIAVGLAIHWRATWLPPTLRDILGDALWAMMIAWWVGGVTPRTSVTTRASVALAICWAVEFSQLYHSRALDGWRLTLLGQLVLGSGFDPRDLGAYAIGVLAALILELTVRGRRRSTSHESGQ